MIRVGNRIPGKEPMALLLLWWWRVQISNYVKIAKSKVSLCRYSYLFHRLQEGLWLYSTSYNMENHDIHGISCTFNQPIPDIMEIHDIHGISCTFYQLKHCYMNNMQLSEQMVKHQTTGIQSRLTQIYILYTYLFKTYTKNVMTNITW